MFRNTTTIFPIVICKFLCYNFFVNGDGTHHKKRLYNTTKGMIPIEKNIIVVDENGKEYEATYPKRAKGLVKNGRARFIDKNTICLACPPKDELEDNKMSENKNVNNNSKPQPPATPAIPEKPTKFTIDYILTMLEGISKDRAHLNAALEKLNKLESKGAGDVGTADLADAIAHVVDAREETNRKLIAFYEKMYDDLKASQPMSEQKFDLLSLTLGDLSRDLTPFQTKEVLTEALKIIAKS